MAAASRPQSPASVQRIWQDARAGAPISSGCFKLSNDPTFAPKVEDIVGLYVDPPAHAVVLSIDEKCPDPSARSHPAGPADEEGPRRDDDPRLQAQRHDHPVRRAQCARRHGHRPMPATPPSSGVHALSQHASSATAPAGKADPCRCSTTTPPTSTGRSAQWLARHPRWIFHFTPTSCSWLNAVEGFFAKLTKRRLKRGVVPFARRVADCHQPLHRAPTTKLPKPFLWQADPEEDHRRRQNVGIKC